jgi:enoyl-[acyl-carrier protein] reductase I
MSFLQLAGRTLLVCGVANRKSVAFHSGQLLEQQGAKVIYAVRSVERRDQVAKLLPGRELHVCDVSDEQQITALAEAVAAQHPRLDGLVHSIAFARYEGGWKPFHQVSRAEFLEAAHISCYSLIALARAFETQFSDDASVVTISISTTRMAAENYGYMAPIKAALDSSIVFLARSFATRGVRFNAVCPGLLKTSASAGIPGYVEAYLYAERATLRQRAVETSEVANAVAFLLSPRSSAINAQGLILDAGMSVNYFDRTLVHRALRDG